MKRVFAAVFLSFCMLFNMSFVAMAEDVIITVNVSEYVERQDAQNLITAYGETFSSFNQGDFYAFEINAPKAGSYEVTIRYAAPSNHKVNISLKDGDVYKDCIEEATLTATGAYNTFGNQSIGVIELEQGKNIVKVQIIQGSAHFADVVLTLGVLEISNVTANSAAVTNGGEVARGADSFAITMSDVLKPETVSASTVYIKDESGEKLNSNISASGKVITVALKETLDFNKNYTLHIENVKSEKAAANVVFPFKTVADGSNDSGSASLSVPDISINNGVITASGYMYGSHGLSMEGRKAYLYVTGPNSYGGTDILATATTDAQGKYSLEHTLGVDAQSGQYNVVVGGEYIDNSGRKSGTVRFVLPETENDIIEAMNGTQETQSVLNDYADILGINPVSTDGGDLAGISDTDFVFNNLADKTYTSVNDIIKAYYAEILTAKINEATGENVVSDILSSVGNCVTLNINQEKREALDEEYSNFVEAVFELNIIENSEVMSEEINELLDKALVQEFGLVAANFRVEENNELFSGDKFVLPVEFTEVQNNVKAVVVDVEADFISDENVAVSFENTQNLNAAIEKAGNKATLKITSEMPIETLNSLGNIVFENISAGTKNVTLKGSVSKIHNGFLLPVDASDKNVNLVVYPRKDGFIYDSSVNAKEFYVDDITTEECNDLPATSNGKKYLAMHKSKEDWLEFEVEFDKEANYHFVLNAGVNINNAPKASITACADGEEEYKTVKDNAVIEETGAWTKFEDRHLATASFKEGTYKIRVAITAGDFYFVGLKIIEASAFGVCDITVGDISLLKANNVKRGSDVIELTFSEKLKENSVDEESITLTGPTGIIPCKISQFDNKIKLVLTQTLEYDSSYTLTVKKAADIYGISEIADKQFTFKTLSSADDSGSASVTELKGKMTYETANITGKLLGSAGQTMANRKVLLYFGDTDAAVANAITNTKGEFVLTYSIPTESVPGSYTFFVGSDYIAEANRGSLALTYILRETGNDFLGDLKETQTANEVKTLIENYETDFAIDVSADIEAAGISDASAFYGHFICADIADMAVFFDKYEKALITETVNQATEETVVSDLFENEETLEVLGISEDRYALLINKKSEFITAVFELGVISDTDEFVDTVNELFEEKLILEYERKNSEITAGNITVNQGFSAAVKLALKEAISGASKITLVVESNNSSYFNGCELKDKVSNSVNYSKVNDNKIVITYEPEKISRQVTDIATLFLAPINSTGTGQLVISGEILYPISETEEYAKASILEKTIAVSVNYSQDKNPNEGGTTTREPSGGASTPSKPAEPSVPASPEDSKENSDSEATSEAFDDLDGVEWAKNSIITLYELGIVSESDNKKFNPNNYVKREEFVKMLVLALGLEFKGESTFGDVNADAWYYQYVSAAQYFCLINGNELGNFGVGESLKRQDLCVIIHRALNKNNSVANKDVVRFNDDSKIASYAKESVYWLRENNMIDGVGENTFAPTEAVTRAMAAKLIASVLNYVDVEVEEA